MLACEEVWHVVIQVLEGLKDGMCQEERIIIAPQKPLVCVAIVPAMTKEVLLRER